MVLGDLDSYMRKMKINHQITPYTKINSRWVKGLNISHDTIKVLEENIGRNISDIPHISIFTDMSPRARDIKERINKWDLIKWKVSAQLKKTSAKWHGNQPYRKIYLPMRPQTRVWSSKIYTELTRLHSRQTNNSIKKWAKGLNRHFSKKEYRGPRGIWKDMQHH